MCIVLAVRLQGSFAEQDDSAEACSFVVFLKGKVKLMECMEDVQGRALAGSLSTLGLIICVACKTAILT